MEYKFPIQIQFDNTAADDSISSMCQVFDGASFHKLTAQLPKIYMHVIAWDADGTEVFKYDNR
mgnify:CR=1 FL=1